MDEFAFIRDYLAPLAGEGAHGLTDDAARLPGGWVISTDTSIEGVHFPSSVRGAAATERAVRVAASDLAAKAAELFGYFVNLTIPKALDDKWLVAMAQGLGDVQTALGMTLLGGDTTRSDGPLTISVTVVGREERSILRSGASVGDEVWMSGTVGDGYLGLRFLQGDNPIADLTGDDMFHMEESFLRPVPRFDLRDGLREHATASIDVSDGVIADAGRIAEGSSVGMDLRAAAFRFSPTADKWISGDEHVATLLGAGDDYEVIYTAKPGGSVAGCAKIGVVSAKPGVRVWTEGNAILPIPTAGYSH